MQEEPLHELITDRNLLEIQGVTLDRNHIRVLGIYALLSIIPTGLFYFWPQAGGLVLLIILFSAHKDLRGKQGWIRTFLLKHCGKNIISWFPERLPNNPDTFPEPAPSIVIALPHNIHTIQRWPQQGIVLCTIGCALLPLSLYIEQPILLGWAAGIFLFTTLLCFALPDPPQLSSEFCITQHNLILSLWQSKERNHRLAILLYEDGVNGGGIPTFLKNYEDFIPSAQTRLVFFEQSEQTQYFIPMGLFGTVSSKNSLPEFMSNSEGKIHTMYSAHTHGWNSILVETPFDKVSLEKVFEHFDATVTL